MIAEDIAPDLIFTEYIRRLEPGGPPPEPSLFDAFWDKLRGALVAEMSRRSLLSAPPGYLGIHAAPQWSDTALDELQSDLYTFVLDRLPSLWAQLRVKDNVEGLIFRNLHNYLHNVQKKYDPVGFRVFEMARTAVRQLIRQERLHVLQGEASVRNETVVGFAPGVDAADAVPPAALEEPVRSFNDDLLPELVTARGKKKDGVASRLADLIFDLSAGDIVAFRFKDLLDPFKKDCRARWSARWAQQEGDVAFEDDDDEPVRVLQVPPDFSIEDRDGFEKLLACMAEALEQADEPPRTREYLERLWIFLRDHAAEGSRDKPPSHRRIARTIAVPRERLPELQDTLGQWIGRCREAAGRAAGHFRKLGVKRQRAG